MVLNKYWKASMAILIGLIALQPAAAQTRTADLKQEINAFLKQELKASLDAIGEPDSQPASLFGEPLGGDFTWSSFAGTLAAYQDFTGQDSIGNHNFINWQTKLVPRDFKSGETFGQLYAGAVLTSHVQADKHNTLLDKLSESDRQAWTNFLQVSRMYDTTLQEPKNGRPNNYLAVAALVAAYRYTLLNEDRDKRYTQQIINKCLTILQANNGFLDDDRKGAGRYDRYSYEFIRFLWDAAKKIDDKALMASLKPFAIKHAKLWKASFNQQTGHSSPFGRSLQNVWDDTFEQVVFYVENPSLSPMPLTELATAWYKAWRYYRTNQHNEVLHLNRMHDDGRTCYKYAGRNRIWGYTTGTLGKIARSAQSLMDSLQKKKITTVLPLLTKLDNSTLTYFRTGKDKMGVWTYNDNRNCFVLPIIGHGGISDYQPMPYGIEGLGFPVDMKEPMLFPYLTISDSIILFADGGCEKLELSPDGKSLKAVWKNWQTVKSKAKAKTVTNTDWPIVLEITWTIKTGGSITCEQTLTSTKPISIKKWHLRAALTYNKVTGTKGIITATTSNNKQKLTIGHDGNFKVFYDIIDNSNAKKGKGAFSRLPVLLDFAAYELNLKPGEKKTFIYTLQNTRSRVE